MSKDYLEKQKQQLAGIRGLTKKTLAELFSDAESPELVREHSRDKSQYIPDLDYGDPANFAKFGLASKYYSGAIKRIYNQYPYDGSLAEQLKFYNDLTPLEQYIFDNNYPKKTGYAIFSPAGWGTQVASTVGNPTDKEYILFYGGPHLGNIYNTSSAQENNLKLDYTQGNAVEFWFKKDTWLNATTEARYETIFDLRSSAGTTNANHRQFKIYLDNNDSDTKTSIHVKDRVNGAGLTGILDHSFSSSYGDIADSKWHHYAISIKKNADDNFINTSFYVDGKFVTSSLAESYDEITTWRALPTWAASTAQTSFATLGAHATSSAATTTADIGWHKLSGSIDEFRFWKTERNAQEIGRHYFTNVAGGTNTDSAKYYYSSSIDKNLVDLGVYYKFNEGILGSTTSSNSTVGDDFVLDYSGRISNGKWVGYLSTSRSTGSAMVDAGVTTEEKGSPVVYSGHSDVQSLITDLEISGSNHDAANNASLYNSMPQWIRDEDGETGETLANLLQMMSSYLDTLYGQIGYINRLKEPYYASGSVKPIPYNKKLLTSTGFDPPEIFLQSKIVEQILARGEKKLYEEKLHNIKNLIYKNIYNNLSYINKSKGTEKAFRNLFRCFGVDDNLFRLNLYGDNVEYELEDTYESVSTKKKVVDFTGFNSKSGNRSAVVYQYPSSSSDYGFISASSDLYIPFTAEAEVIFPKFPTSNHTVSSDLSLLPTASLFGCHSSTASMDDQDAVFGVPDRDFQVEAVKVDNGERVYFRLKSSNEWFDEIATVAFPQDGESSAKVYDNSKWNFAVRVRPNNYPIFSNIITSSGFYLDFYGVNNYLGEVQDEFSLSASITTEKAGDFITGSNKKFFVGAHRENFTGTVSEKSDVRVSSLRVWHDYISDEEMQHHARDPNNFGRLHPGRTITTASAQTSAVAGVQFSASIHVPQADALALNWDFETTPTADSSGEFLIKDVSSGSAALLVQVNSSSYAKINHTAKGYGFVVNDDPTSFEFIPTTRQLQPENLYSSDLVNILSTDDLFFTRESRPVKHFFSIEASMYEIISRRILNFFASIVDFNNQIGEPINRFRGRYKGLEKLRNMFFDKIEEVSDVEKFVELYKWLDNALDTAVANLLPASANASKEVRSVVENHVLARNKYQHRPPLFVDVPNIGAPGHTGPEESPWVELSGDYPDEVVDVDPGLKKLVTVIDVPAAEKAAIIPVLGCFDKAEAWCGEGNYARLADNYKQPIGGKALNGHQPGSCKWFGCKNDKAKNYDECAKDGCSAGYGGKCDSGECEYVWGCMNKCYKGYNPEAVKSKFSECKKVYGCLDTKATNYWKNVPEVVDKMKTLAGNTANPGTCTEPHADEKIYPCKYLDVEGCCDSSAFNKCDFQENYDHKKLLTGIQCSVCKSSLCKKYVCKKKLSGPEIALGLVVENYNDSAQHESCTKDPDISKQKCCQISGCKDGESLNEKDCLNCSDLVTKGNHEPKKCKYKCCHDKTAANYKAYDSTADKPGAGLPGDSAAFAGKSVLCDPDEKYNKEVCEYISVCKTESISVPNADGSGTMVRLWASNYNKLTKNYGKYKAGESPPAGKTTVADQHGCIFPACTEKAITGKQEWGDDVFDLDNGGPYVLNMVNPRDNFANDPNVCRFKCCLNAGGGANNTDPQYGSAGIFSPVLYFGWQCIQHSDLSCEYCRDEDDTIITICKGNDCDPATKKALKCSNCGKCQGYTEEADACTAAGKGPCCEPKDLTGVPPGKCAYPKGQKKSQDDKP